MFTVLPFSLAAAGVILGLAACCLLRPPSTSGPPAGRGISHPGIALGSASAALLLAAILLLARGVRASDALPALDRAVSLAVRDHARPWLTSALKVGTWLGSLAIVIPLMAIGGGLLLRRRRPLDALLLATVTLGAAGLNALAKLVVKRPRPDFILPLIARPETYSFPSGHAATATAFYLSAALLATEGPDWTWGRRSTALAAALIVTCAVGFSRIYLGVHYLGDVVAGVALGTLWLVLCVIAAALWDARRGRAA